MADNYILVIDDWNWDKVRKGTEDGLKSVGAKVDFSIEVRTTMDNELTQRGGAKSDWHNGFYMAAIKKT